MRCKVTGSGTRKVPAGELPQPVINEWITYGTSKLIGARPLNNESFFDYNLQEKLFLYNSDYIILRVPILYGPLEYLDESAVTTLFNAVQNTTIDCKMNDLQRRFPTHTEDVAKVLKDNVQRRLQVLDRKVLHQLHKKYVDSFAMELNTGIGAIKAHPWSI